MKKRVLTTLIILTFITFSVFASDVWYDGVNISGFDIQGLSKIDKAKVDKVLSQFVGVAYSDSVFADIQNRLYSVDGVNYVIAQPQQDGAGLLQICLEFHELPVIKSISFRGNSKIKTADLTEALTIIKQDAFIDTSKAALIKAAESEIKAAYSEKGFSDIGVNTSVRENQDSTVDIQFQIAETRQKRIVEIVFQGNSNIASAMLMKQVSSKRKALFQPGYMDDTKLAADVSALTMYYQTFGYADVIVDSPVIEVVDAVTRDYDECRVTFNIIEGEKWYYGGLSVSGNTIFTDEQIYALQTINVGDILNMQKVQEQFSAIADLYYNNGYISNKMDISEKRDDTKMTIAYSIDITESTQAIIEDVIVSGLEKTKDYVMLREIELKPGDVFSKAKLTTSAQNLFNTGLLSNVDYDMYYGKDPDNLILDFKLTEGDTKDIQFGATFGGDVKGFPISAFLSLSNNNFTGRGQKVTVSTSLSPTNQSVGLSFGDNWFGNKRWSNTFSFNFSRVVYEDELQRASGSPYYDGRNQAWPHGYAGYAEWNRSEELYPSYDKLMDYSLITFSVGWNTGYTWIFDKGRLSLTGGLNVGVKKANYDDKKYDPFEKLIKKYHENSFGNRFSNRLTFSFQWDGRDYVKNTTKGYVLGLGTTYAGGFMQGLANYIKLTTSGSGYLKLFDVNHKKEGTSTPVMFCATTAFNVMLPQFYTNYDDAGNRGLKWHDPRLGATKYEMLYIDGMTIARGFDTISDQSMLWDNMLEISYQVIKNVVQAEIFTSGTYLQYNLKSNVYKTDGWYFAGGAGLKLKVSGFPLGLYIVKNATIVQKNGWRWVWQKGNLFSNNKEGSGFSVVLAISTSLI